MEPTEMSIIKLEAEFDQLLLDLKPHVLKLPQQNERHQCALWLKKFCEPTGSTVTAKKNRNLYAQLLLCFLKRGSLEGPFLKNPEFGPLPLFPSQLSMYFNGNASTLVAPIENKVPDWVAMELQNERSDSSRSIANATRRTPDESFLSSHETDNFGQFTDMRFRFATNGLDRPSRARLPFEDQLLAEDSLRAQQFENMPPVISRSAQANGDASSLQHCFKNNGEYHQIHQPMVDSPRSFLLDTRFTGVRDDSSFTPTQLNELELRVKMVESKFQEDSLKLRHQHDCNVKKILDRKNTEIEEIKEHYQVKSQEREAVINELEKKVTHLQRELSAVQELRDQQIKDLQRQTEENVSSKQTVLDKKLHEMAMTHEQQKYDLQKRHTLAIQELMEETNGKLSKMQNDYDNLTESTSTVIKELESRVQQLSLEVENVTRVRTQLEQRKSDLETQVERIHAELADFQSRLSVKDKEMENTLTEHQIELRSLQNKYDVNLESLKNEHRFAEAKSSEAVNSFQSLVSELKQKSVEAHGQLEKDARNLELMRQSDELQQTKLSNLQFKLDQQEQQYAKKVKKYEQLISQKDSEINRLSRNLVEQAEIAQKNLDEFKVQIENNSAKMYEEMKHQLEKVETDLIRAKQSREKQTHDAERQREELLRTHAEQIAELKMKHEIEKARQAEDFYVQAELQTLEKAKELADLRDTLQANIADVERRSRERMEKDAKIRTQLEAQAQRLREEMMESGQQHKKELMELRFARDQELHTHTAEFHSQISKLDAQMEEQRFELEKRHSSEIEKLQENTTCRIRELENDYVTRGNRSAETINELHSAIEKLQDDIVRQRHDLEQQLLSMKKLHAEERNNIKQQYSSHLSTIQHELNLGKEEILLLEQQLRQQQLEEDEKLTRLRSQYEDRLKGMMKAEIKKELEDTIASLRTQVCVIQRRAALLQDDLNERNNLTTEQRSALTSLSSPLKVQAGS